MNAARLLEHFERIADAPDAIPRLRKFILELAFRGKLVEQDRQDEPALELLKRIQSEKLRLVKNGFIRKDSFRKTPNDPEVMFDLPNGWNWTVLGNLTKLITSGSRDWAKYCSNEGAIFVRMGNLSRDSYKLRLNNIQRVTPPIDTEGARTKLQSGDILVSITGDVGLLGLIPSGFGEAYINQHTCLVRPICLLHERFIPEFFRSPFAQTQFKGPQRGIKNSFRLTDVADIRVPVPPLAEQHRIVAKVDELMALCDRLETIRAKRESRRNRLAAASLKRIGQPEAVGNDEEFQENVRFHLHHLPRLTTRPEHVKELRQTILNLAVRGKLVPQDPNDEPASELLKKIHGKKLKLQKSKCCAKKAVSLEHSSGRLYSDKLNKWALVKFDALSDLVTSGSRGWSEYYSSTGAKFIRAQNIRFGRLLLDELAYVKLPGKTEGVRTQVEAKDILVVITGAGVTNPALLESGIGEAYVSQHVALIKPTERAISRWMLLCLMSPAGGRAELVERAYGAGKPGLNLDNIRSLAIPLPPLAEQHRIVAKVDELMNLCDLLEVQLATSQRRRSRLLEATLSEALSASRIAETHPSRSNVQTVVTPVQKVPATTPQASVFPGNSREALAYAAIVGMMRDFPEQTFPTLCRASWLLTNAERCTALLPLGKQQGFLLEFGKLGQPQNFPGEQKIRFWAIEHRLGRRGVAIFPATGRYKIPSEFNFRDAPDMMKLAPYLFEAVKQLDESIVGSKIVTAIQQVMSQQVEISEQVG